MTDSANDRPPVDAAAATSDKDRLVEAINRLGVVHQRVTLASGRQADYYIDMRRVTLDGAAAPLVGRVMRELLSGWDYEAVGGLTLGADPVAYAIMHAASVAGHRTDAFVVRKQVKDHGMGRLIEGTEVAGRRVVAVEDTSTTGGSVLQAVDALEAAGAIVVGVAVIVDRDTGARERVEGRGYEYRYAVGLDDLGLAPQV